MVKVKFFSNYDSSDVLAKRFTDNYQTSNGHGIDLVLDDTYDVAVVFNKTYETIKKDSKKLVVVQEPSWSPVWYDNSFSYADYVLVHDKSLFNGFGVKNEIIECPSFMWYHDHVGKSTIDSLFNSIKSKKLSMIVSGLNMSTPNTNYTKRIGLLEKILESDLDIDIFGKGLNIQDSRFKGPVKYKYQGLSEYEYSIAIENSCERNYVSEKFFDCTLCNTKPIYYGAPNIASIYDWYDTLDLDSPHVITDIKNIIEKDSRNPELSSKDFNRYFTEYNLYHKILEIFK